MPCPSPPVPGADFFVERLGDTPIGVAYPVTINLMQVTKSIFQPRDIGYDAQTATLPGIVDEIDYSVTLLNGTGTLEKAPGNPTVTFIREETTNQFVATALLTVGDPAGSPLKFRLETSEDPGTPLVPLIWDITIRVYDPEYENGFGFYDPDGGGLILSGHDWETGLQVQLGLHQIYKKGIRGSRYPRASILNQNNADPYSWGSNIGPWVIIGNSLIDFSSIDTIFLQSALGGRSPTLTPTYGESVNLEDGVTLTIKYLGAVEDLPDEFAGMLDDNLELEFPVCRTAPPLPE